MPILHGLCRICAYESSETEKLVKSMYFLVTVDCTNALV